MRANIIRVRPSSGCFRTLQENSFLAGLPTDAALTRAETNDRASIVVPFVLDEPWRGAGARTQLYAAYFRDANTSLHAFVSDTRIEETSPTNITGFAALAARHRAALLDFTAPFVLGTVDVPKPWGKEIWYTGYEQRGVSVVRDAHGATPLPWALACAPQRLCRERPILLLKILSSAPQPVTGALYLELHREKREVYVVTSVDRGAWPSGIAAVRYGVNQQLRRTYADDAAFRDAFVATVKRYERVRREIDAAQDAGESIDAALAHREAECRAAMDEFTTLHPLATGDSVCVPALVPHSLQHGVRAIEVQTPTYERQIIAAGHKVLTQSHWDTDAAARVMQIDMPTPVPKRHDVPAPGTTRERLTTLDDFAVTRYGLAPGSTCRAALEGPYALAIVANGEVSVDSTLLGAENACMLPGTMDGEVLLNNRTAMSASILIAQPRARRSDR